MIIKRFFCHFSNYNSLLDHFHAVLFCFKLQFHELLSWVGQHVLLYVFGAGKVKCCRAIFEHILTYGFGALFWMCMWIWNIESDVPTWASKWVFLIHSKLTWIWPWGSRLGLRKYSSNHLPILTRTDFLPADSTNGLARWWKIKNDSIM